MADNIPSFGWGGVGAAEDPEAIRRSLFERALPFTDTFGMAAKSGVLQSLGLGTGIRNAQLPEAAPTEEGQIVETQRGSVLLDAPSSYADDRSGGGASDVNTLMADRFETAGELGARRQAAGAISEEDYKASPYFRPDIPWSPAMTTDRARVQSEFRDAQRAREFFQEKRPITSFFGTLAGGALDPTNYIPVAGPAVRAAAIARAGRVLGTAAVMAGEAASTQAALGLVTAPSRQQFGDDVSWQAQVTDIAMGALTGGLVGGVVGKVSGHFAAKADSLKNQMKARAVLDDAARGLAEDGEVRLSQTSAGLADEVSADFRPLQNFDDFMRLVDQRRRQTLVEPTAQRRDPLASTADAPFPTTARFTPFADLNIKDPEALARAGSPDLFREFDEITANMRGMREDIAALSKARAPEAQAIRSELREIEADFNRTPPEQWPAIETRKADAQARLDEVTAIGDTPAMAEKRAALLETDNRLRDLAPAVGRALEQGRSEFRALGLPPDVQRMLQDFDLQGGVRFRDRPAFDFTSPLADPDPVRIRQEAKAAASVGKPETPDGFAKDIGFDPETGQTAATALVKQIEAEGRLTAQDAAAIKVADDGIADADAFSKALEVATGCVI